MKKLFKFPFQLLRVSISLEITILRRLLELERIADRLVMTISYHLLRYITHRLYLWLTTISANYACCRQNVPLWSKTLLTHTHLLVKVSGIGSRLNGCNFCLISRILWIYAERRQMPHIFYCLTLLCVCPLITSSESK